MIQRSRRAPYLATCFALATGIALIGEPFMALAQQYTPPARGIPGRREGAGTRGPRDVCIRGQKPLMALAPADNFSITTSKAPTLFWYVPPTIAKTAEIRLLDSNDQELYTGSTNLTGAGVVSYQLPRQAASQMVSGKVYRWQFSLICDADDPSRNPFVEGILQRTEPSARLTRALKQAATPRDRATAFAAAGIWQDAISTLATQRCTKPEDANGQIAWDSLLKSVQLENFAQESFIPGCAASRAKP